jgi:predicted membrane chloride channel (bestrophin family)
MKAAIRELGVVPYGEESRKYRRTVFTQDDWLKHRSTTRLIKNLKGTFNSGVVRSLITEVGIVTAISVLIVVWNCAFAGYVDWSNVVRSAPLAPWLPAVTLQLPALPFTLSSPALGLLLVFRTNSSYQRWLEARTTWGKVVAQLRNVVRQGAVWLDPTVADAERDRVLKELGLSAWAFCMALRWALCPTGERPAIADELRGSLGVAAADVLLSAPNPPVRALRNLSACVVRLPMDEKRRVEMDKSCIVSASKNGPLFAISP